MSETHALTATLLRPEALLFAGIGVVLLGLALLGRGRGSPPRGSWLLYPPLWWTLGGAVFFGSEISHQIKLASAFLEPLSSYRSYVRVLGVEFELYRPGLGALCLCLALLLHLWPRATGRAILRGPAFAQWALAAIGAWLALPGFLTLWWDPGWGARGGLVDGYEAALEAMAAAQRRLEIGMLALSVAIGATPALLGASAIWGRAARASSR